MSLKNTKSEPAQTAGNAPELWLPIVQQIYSHKPILACPKCTATSDRQASKMCSGNEDNCPMDGADWIERIVKLNIETIASGFFGDPSAASSQEAATPQDYKALVELAARVLLQHMNDEDYEMSLAGLYAKLTEKYPLEVADHAPTPEPTGLFNWYTSLHRGFIFSKRMRIVEAMTAAMYAAEQSVAEPAPSPATKETLALGQEWIDSEMWNFVHGAADNLGLPDEQEAQLHHEMCVVLNTYLRVIAPDSARASSQGPAREETIIDLAKKMSAAGYCNVGACKEYLQSAFDAGAKSVVAAPQLENRSDKDYAIEHGEYLAKAATEFLKVSNERAKIGEESDSMEDLMNADEVLADHRGTLESAVYEFRKRAKRALAGAAALPSAQNECDCQPPEIACSGYKWTCDKCGARWEVVPDDDSILPECSWVKLPSPPVPSKEGE